jgi:hypothetical protein
MKINFLIYIYIQGAAHISIFFIQNIKKNQEEEQETTIQKNKKKKTNNQYNTQINVHDS